MSRPKYGTKMDKNQKDMVAQLRDLGYDVDVIARAAGLYDLVVSGEKHTSPDDHHIAVDTVSVRVEVKRPGEKLFPTEQIYHDKQRHGGSLIIAESVDDVLVWFGRV